MKTSSAKAKGRRLQKLVVSKILAAFTDLTERDVQSRAMGSQGTDVVLSEKAFKYFPFAIEAKNQEANKKLLDMFGQASDHSNKSGGEPVLVVSANNSPVLAIVTLDIFMKLIRENYVASKI